MAAFGISPQKISIYAHPSNLFKPQGFPLSPSFCQCHKIAEGGRNYTKISLSNGEEKHGDTCMPINTTRNKIRTKYSKEVS